MGSDAALTSQDEITLLLRDAADSGSKEALGRVFELLHAELKILARSRVGGGGSATISPTVLVNELFIKFTECRQLALAGRVHFFATAARAMRQIVTDAARAALAGKRGGEMLQITLSESDFADDQRTLVALDEALDDLERIDPALRQLVELRFYAGLSMAEIAALVGRSERSLHRDWERARALLNAMLVA
ncbi:ECF-type sigma factor [Pseudomarimonas salicorniae]|uniref:ECF-type sigma factor n=1 Tax=Pseudomarimonas salicorniae TaxID=2933270 RepID=A0ABT0GEV8_9GAMM|nr:ECF-type sigma factor [Lysobacter sp. CAU 1642]MCK7593066.1 ECF-type sigma factor [Lysobacter sp. CAU 1642]